MAWGTLNQTSLRCPLVLVMLRDRKIHRTCSEVGRKNWQLFCSALHDSCVEMSSWDKRVTSYTTDSYMIHVFNQKSTCQDHTCVCTMLHVLFRSIPAEVHGSDPLFPEQGVWGNGMESNAVQLACFCSSMLLFSARDCSRVAAVSG